MLIEIQKFPKTNFSIQEKYFIINNDEKQNY